MPLIPPKNTINDWNLPHRMFYQFVKLFLPRLLRWYFRFEVNNIEFIRNLPEGVPVIYCFNHRSHLDTFLVASALVYPFGNRTACGLMTSGKAMEQKVFSLLKYLGAYPIYSENSKPALEYTHRLLKEKLAVIIAPQGRRFPNNPIEDFHRMLLNTKSGVGRVILKFNGKIPVVPIYIHGSQEALDFGMIIPKMNSYISISICKPIIFTKYQQEGGWIDSDEDFYTIAHEISKQIMGKIRDQMLFQERYFFQIIRNKYNIPLEELEISPDTNFKAYQLISKLMHYSPDELKQMLGWIQRVNSYTEEIHL